MEPTRDVFQPKGPRTRKFYIQNEKIFDRYLQQYVSVDMTKFIHGLVVAISKLKTKELSKEIFEELLERDFTLKKSMKLKKPELFGKSEDLPNSEKNEEFVPITTVLPKKSLDYLTLTKYHEAFLRLGEVYDYVYDFEKIPENLRQKKLKSLSKSWLKLTKKSGKQSWKWN